MPVHFNLAENEILGPTYLKGLAEGEQKGEQKGRHAGEVAILRRQIEKRFGRMPARAVKRLASRSTAELEELSERVLDAASLDDLLK